MCTNKKTRLSFLFIYQIKFHGVILRAFRLYWCQLLYSSLSSTAAKLKKLYVFVLYLPKKNKYKIVIKTKYNLIVYSYHVHILYIPTKWCFLYYDGICTYFFWLFIYFSIVNCVCVKACCFVYKYGSLADLFYNDFYHKILIFFSNPIKYQKKINEQFEKSIVNNQYILLSCKSN